MIFHRTQWLTLGLGLMAAIVPLAQTNIQRTDQIVHNGLQLNGLQLNSSTPNKHSFYLDAGVQPDWFDPANTEVKLVDLYMTQTSISERSTQSISIEDGQLVIKSVD